jgi:LemA protein
MDTSFAIGIVAGGAVALLLMLLVWRVYNRMVGLRLKVTNGWADVDVELKRRHDLVPQLVETVRGYMQHERELLENVTQTRAAAVAGTGSIDARTAVELQLTGVVQQLLARAERYPQLQAVENFKLLHEQLVSTENRVAFARQHYNEAVRHYNTARSSFPANVIAGMMGFQAANLFAGADTDRAVPAV